MTPCSAPWGGDFFNRFSSRRATFLLSSLHFLALTAFSNWTRSSPSPSSSSSPSPSPSPPAPAPSFPLPNSSNSRLMTPICLLNTPSLCRLPTSSPLILFNPIPTSSL